MTEQRLKNIAKKEEILNKMETFLGEANGFLEKWKEMNEEYQSLTDYYFSEQWREDFEASNQGEISKIPHGVLSEDAIYNTLIEQKDLAIRLLKLATKILED